MDQHKNAAASPRGTPLHTAVVFLNESNKKGRGQAGKSNSLLLVKLLLWLFLFEGSSAIQKAEFVILLIKRNPDGAPF